jgi:hypothetical protein
LLSSLILKQYKSIKRYFVKQSYIKTVQKYKKILLIQKHILLNKLTQKHTLKDKTKSYISYNIAAKAKAHTLI